MIQALGRLIWKAFLEASRADECDSILDVAKELNEVGPIMKLFVLTTGSRSLIQSKVFCCFSELLEKQIGNCIVHPFIKYCPGSLLMIE